MSDGKYYIYFAHIACCGGFGFYMGRCRAENATAADSQGHITSDQPFNHPGRAEINGPVILSAQGCEISHSVGVEHIRSFCCEYS